MRVLHVTASLSTEWGGPVNVVVPLTTALTKIGIECEIVASRGLRVGTDLVSTGSVPTHRFETELPARLWTAYSSKLSNFLDGVSRDFDLIHAHELWNFPAYAAFRAASKAGIPYVLTTHGELNPWSLSHRWLKKWVYMNLVQKRILNNADALHAITQAEKDRIRELGFQTPVFVAPNGVYSDEFSGLPDPAEFLDAHPALKGKTVILYLSRIHSGKGVDILARAYSKIKATRPNVALLMVGPDEDGSGQTMRTELERAGVADSVVFTGTLSGDERQVVFSCASLFVLPSYTEGFSIAILEALAASLPVVITSNCNFPEVADAEAGIVVEANDESLAGGLTRLLEDPLLRDRMSVNARNLVRERYSWDATARSIADEYANLVDARREGTRIVPSSVR